MKQSLTFTGFAILLLLTTAVYAKTLEIEVDGMTCAFCVESLERKLQAMPSVTEVQVSMRTKKVRLQTKSNGPTIEAIKQVILDAGFTPVKVTIVTDEVHQ